MRRYRPVAVLLTVLHLTACSTWQPVAVRSEPVPGTVRVTTDSGHIFLRDTRLVGDTAIAGVADGSLRSIPLARFECPFRRCIVRTSIRGVRPLLL